MRPTHRSLAGLAIMLAATSLPGFTAMAQTAIGTPDRVESPLGTLDYKDGVPTAVTVQKVYDNLDLMHAVDVYLNAFAGASTSAIVEGFRSIGVEANQILIYPRLMDAKSVFLTANADTVFDGLRTDFSLPKWARVSL